MIRVETENLTHTYSKGTMFEKTAVEDVSISIESGEIMGIIGHTGSGKSTLIQHLNGLLKPTSGRVLVDGTDIFSKGYNRTQLRSRVGLVFQYPEYQLFEETVEKDIAFGPKNMGRSEEEIKKAVEMAAGFTGLTDEELQASPFELSGGQKRRAALAGVLAMKPEMLVLDEPAAGLDPLSRRNIMFDILAYAKETKTAILLVSHSMEDIATYTERVAVMQRGKIVMQGKTADIFRQSDKLAECGLTVPQITKIFKELGAPEAVLTVDQGKKQALKMLGRCSDD